MTETSFQAGRKVMQKANYLRGVITTKKGDVAKWTRIEDVHRREGRISQADGAKKILDKAIDRLNAVRKQFADLKFPQDDLKEEVTRCKGCGSRIAAGNEYCGECMCEDDCDY